MALFVLWTIPVRFFARLIITIAFKIARKLVEAIELIILLWIPKPLLTRITNYAYSPKKIQASPETLPE